MKTVYEDNSQIHKQYEEHILRHKVAYEKYNTDKNGLVLDGLISTHSCIIFTKPPNDIEGGAVSWQ